MVGAAEADTIRCYYLDQPLSRQGPDGHAVGPLITVLDLLAKRAGVSFEYHTGPWSRAQMMLRRDEIDAYVTVASAARRAYLLFAPTPLLSTQETLYHRAGDPRFAHVQTPADLRGMRQLALLGQETEPVFDPAHLVRLRSIEAVVRMLAAGRGDYVLSDPTVMAPMLQALTLPEPIVGSTAPFLRGIDFNLGLRRSYPDAAAIVARLELAIQAMKSSGELDRLLPGKG